jgi:hypothetical protein
VTTWDLRAAGKSRPRRLAYLANLCDELFHQNDIDIVRIEAPLPLRAMMNVGTSEEVMLLLRGAIGVVEARASHADITDIELFQVQAARKHFLGQARFAKNKETGRSAAKDHVLIMCDTLGIKVHNDNEADAVAGWSYCCALANPRIAHLSTPLFQGRTG